MQLMIILGEGMNEYFKSYMYYRHDQNYRYIHDRDGPYVAIEEAEAAPRQRRTKEDWRF